MGRKAKWGDDSLKITVRMSREMADFLDAQVQAKRAKGVEWDRTQEVLAAIIQRRLSLLSPEQRRELLLAKKAQRGAPQGELFHG